MNYDGNVSPTTVRDQSLSMTDCLYCMPHLKQSFGRNDSENLGTQTASFLRVVSYLEVVEAAVAVAGKRLTGMLLPKWLGHSRPPRLRLFSRASCQRFGTCNAPYRGFSTIAGYAENTHEASYKMAEAHVKLLD